MSGEARREQGAGGGGAGTMEAGGGAAHQHGGCGSSDGHAGKAGGAERVRLDELLEVLFYLREDGLEATAAAVAERLQDANLAGLVELARAGRLVSVAGDGRLTLEPEGESRATGIVRRHRLAEILFSQVLEVPEDEVEPNACEMEHILSTGVADSVCAFLGHPPRCPHGKAIPSGACCKSFSKDVRPLVIPLSELDVGREGTVVFISTRREGLLARLGDLGVAPGARARLLQRYPSCVVQVNETSVALEEKIAREIYVRREA